MLIRWDGPVLWDALKQRVPGHHAFRPSVGVGMHPDPVHLSDGVRTDAGRGEREGPSGPDLERSP